MTIQTPICSTPIISLFFERCRHYVAFSVNCFDHINWEDNWGNTTVWFGAVAIEWMKEIERKQWPPGVRRVRKQSESAAARVAGQVETWSIELPLGQSPVTASRRTMAFFAPLPFRPRSIRFWLFRPLARSPPCLAYSPEGEQARRQWNQARGETAKRRKSQTPSRGLAAHHLSLSVPNPVTAARRAVTPVLIR